MPLTDGFATSPIGESLGSGSTVSVSNRVDDCIIFFVLQ